MMENEATLIMGLVLVAVLLVNTVQNYIISKQANKDPVDTTDRLLKSAGQIIKDVRPYVDESKTQADDFALQVAVLVKTMLEEMHTDDTTVDTDEKPVKM